MTYYDILETRNPQQREQELFAALRKQIAHAQQHAPAFTKILSGVDANKITDRKALSTLPITRKSDLQTLQRANLPFGGLAAKVQGTIARVFSSPGPIYEPEGRRADYWRLARAMHAAGFRAGDLVHNTFAYTFTPAGFMADLAAQALGCIVFPAGVGQTEMQVTAINELKPTCYVGTPSFLRIILEKADEMKVDVSSINNALVSGEAFLPAVREMLKQRCINALQCYATADLGLIAYETPAGEGMTIDEGVLVEIVRPGTGEPVAEGEVGEVVVSTLTPEYPLIRFATGDLSAVMSGASPCGRTNMRIKGWMGRADQTTKVKGMFVHPSQIADVAKRHPEISKYRLVVDHDESKNDRMTLCCETAQQSDALAQAVAASLRDITKMRGDVKFVALGSLVNDGKVIDDVRKYD